MAQAGAWVPIIIVVCVCVRERDEISQNMVLLELVTL